MHSFKFLPSFLTLLGLVSWAAAISSPMKTSGRWIVDANNQRVKLRCVNWAGHMEMHIPEGLQHQPINTITAWIASNGFNCVRLTYSVDMAINPDVMVADAFTSGGQAAGLTTEVTQGIYQLVQEKNGFVANSTVLDVYQEIIRSLERQNIMVVLDNHVSKASWCCGGADGNGWFGDGTDNANSRFFDVDLWKAGLRNISAMTLQQHPNVIGMSLRNELRPASGQNKGNDEWYRLSEEGANVIHDNNPNLLIVVGGVNYATDSSFLFSRAFNRDAFADKVVWEFHSYMWSYGKDTSTNCASLTKKIGNDVGFLLTENQPYTGPLWLSEFGIDQSISADDRTYMNCLVDYMTGNDADWAVWALQGTYYVRDGQTDLSESFGVLNDNWSDWRNPEFKTLLGEMWNVNQGI